MNRPIDIYSLTEAGNALGNRIVKLLTADVQSQEKVQHVHCAKPFKAAVQESFKKGHALILICATGIAVRTLAAVLESKLTDPPVLVLDELGKYVIPLVSGHEGGANNWSQELSNRLGAINIQTTANAYVSPKYSVGMGCERGCPKEHLRALLLDTLAKNNLTVQALSSIASIDIKADEVGLIELTRELGISFETFSAAELRSVEEQLSVKSDYIFNTVGVYGVAESAALVALNTVVERTDKNRAELVQTKLKTDKATCAIARIYSES